MVDRMHQFIFDVKLASEISVVGKSAKLAELQLAKIVEDMNKVINAEFAKCEMPSISIDLYMDDAGGPYLISIDGADTNDLELES